MSKERNFDGLVFDTFAWVDYLAGGNNAKRVAELLDDAAYSKKFTPATAVAELTEKLLREGVDKSKIDQVIKFIASKTIVYPCDQLVAHRAGEINFTQKKKVKDWGMLDSLNYAVASVLHCLFVTGDPHFKRFQNIIFLQ